MAEIKDAVYTAPSGKSFTFIFEDLSKETLLKNTEFTFPGKEGSYIQSHGRAGRRFPFTCIFSGPDCMERADAFEAGLAEIGYGELQHPIYGVHKVVPTGTIQRSDKLTTAANQSTVDISFSETITDELPASTAQSTDALEGDLAAFEDASAAAFADDLAIGSVSESIQAQNNLRTMMTAVGNFLGKVGQYSKSASAKMKEIQATIDHAIDTVVTGPLNTARTVLNLIKTPSRILVSALLKLDGYGGLIKQLAQQFSRDPFGINNVRNAYAGSRLVMYSSLASAASGTALASLSGASGSDSAGGGADAAEGSGDSGGSGAESVSAANPAVFASREEAIAAAERIADLLEVVKDFSDTKIDKDVLVDTDAGYSELLAIVNASLDIIINQAFAAPMRRIITLET